MIARCRQHRVDVMNIPKTDDAGKICTRNGQPDRVGACRKHQSVITFNNAVFGGYFTPCAIDLNHFLAGMQSDVVFMIPVDIVQHDVINGFSPDRTGDSRMRL